ncbi:g5762 [Coccomyxa elongata]
MAKLLQVKAFLFGLCVATWNLGLPVSASSVRHLLQSYDDTVGGDNWRIDSGLEAECDGTGYPASNWGGQTRLRHSRSNGFIIVQIRITISVLVRGYFGERFTADSTFTFRFTDDAYNSYAANNWLWTPAQASTLIKLSDGQGNFLIVATNVTVNIQEWNIRIFEVVNIIANTCPSSGGCSGNGCGQNACGSSDCGTANAAAFAGVSAGSSPRVSSGSDNSSGGSSGSGDGGP